jgi:hypothetical protein
MRAKDLFCGKRHPVLKFDQAEKVLKIFSKPPHLLECTMFVAPKAASGMFASGTG